jgi:hypothetical protein
MHTLGECYCAMGLYEQALPLGHQVLDLRYQALGLEHPLVAKSMHALNELHQASLTAIDSVICGYLRARTDDVHTTTGVSQEALHTLLKAGFAAYDPAKGPLTTYAKRCAYWMRKRYYTAQQNRARVTRSLRESHTGSPSSSDEADTRDVLERLPEVATSSSETEAIATEEDHLE